jgi:2-polyprenyl-3-methyl-5-hydroxy-6-metoxy-1,4-benzoquinol methylase
MDAERTATTDYEAKPRCYFEETRSEMLPFVPADCRRVLDVGCSSGGFGALLKATRQLEVWGVEPFESAAAQAAQKLDRVIYGGFSAEAALPEATFDCVIFNDVLEHVVDPAAAIRYASRLLTPGGVVVASIPNIRHFPTIWRLLVHGEWKYREWGTLDKTHLRFFTRSSIIEMFEAEGYRVRGTTGINSYVGVPNASARVWRLYKAINALCLNKFEDMKFQQFAVVAAWHLSERP